MCDTNEKPKPLKFALLADAAESRFVEDLRTLQHEHIKPYFPGATIKAIVCETKDYGSAGALQIRNKHPNDVLDRVGKPLDFEHDVLIVDSHGGIVNIAEKKLKEGKSIPGKRGVHPPDSNHRAGDRSAVMFQKKFLILAQDLIKFPQLPNVLFLSLSCYGGWEPSLARAVLKRGCKYFLGFRSESSNQDAQIGFFLKRWGDRGGRASDIPGTFASWAPITAECYPILYFIKNGELTATVAASDYGKGRQTCEHILKEASVDFADLDAPGAPTGSAEVTVGLKSRTTVQFIAARDPDVYKDVGATTVSDTD